MDYIVDRLTAEIDFYDSKAIEARKSYYRWSIAGLVMTGLIPLFATASDTFPYSSAITSWLGAAATFTSSYTLLKKHQEHWKRYRMACESLKAEKIFFENKSGAYTSLPDVEAKKLLVERCESIMQAERGTWETLMTTKK